MTKKIRIDRRFFLGGVSSLGVMSLLACGTSQDTAFTALEDFPNQKTFVLVHGAWHGGWCWEYVRDILQSKGHIVFTPTLTGLAEKADLLTKDVSLQTHIDDVQSLIEEKELQNVVLVGHSYAGMVITGVVDAIKERIAHIVYLDAVFPQNGESLLTQGGGVSDDDLQGYLEYLKSRSKDDGLSMAPSPASSFGVDPEDLEMTQWVEDKLTPHPLRTWTDTIRLENGGAEGVPATYILCTHPQMEGAGFEKHANRLEGKENWSVYRLPTGHDAMVLVPTKLASILENATVTKK